MRFYSKQQTNKDEEIEGKRNEGARMVENEVKLISFYEALSKICVGVVA